MAWQNRWQPGTKSNLLSVYCAPWAIDLPNGKRLHGRKPEMVKEALKHGVDRMYDRAKKQWVRFNKKTGKTGKPLTDDTRA